MMKLTLASAAVLGMLAGPLMAQTTTPSATPGAIKMSQADCEAAWMKLDSGRTGSVAKAQAEASVSDFMKADSNSDGKLSSAEFMQACDTGMVKGSATTGTGTGTGKTN